MLELALAAWLLGRDILYLQLDASQIHTEFFISFENVAQSQNNYFQMIVYK